MKFLKKKKIQFYMANGLIEIKTDENELMINIKNIFLNEFLKKKYNEQEKKYINDNIIFLKKESDIINLIYIFLNNYYY